jgi:hypothetical protein
MMWRHADEQGADGLAGHPGYLASGCVLAAALILQVTCRGDGR